MEKNMEMDPSIIKMMWNMWDNFKMVWEVAMVPWFTKTVQSIKENGIDFIK